MENLYRKIGIGLLIAFILLFIRINYAIFMALASLLIFDVTFNMNPFLLLGESVYESILVFARLIIEDAILIWTFVISIVLIRTNRYSRQLLYAVYSLIAVNILFFLLYLPLKKYLVMDLVVGAVVYFFFIHQDNQFSKAIKNKN